ncbi:hypothetical protein [Bradyrhizobium elkanii]|uniref:Uncharacterized protein n=1 Tax=Bradyrhizobium elkanii TaxID=29448 RepID=A0ABV4FIW0_BRAEL|nr:hypothetical protein [Bradyrhizobium elkanii]MCP1754388.1 hypothetical protein [Bradyrhizobium elkanii]MCP1979908.1 hypothetical protein [Bradyrhizobium elkanii]MCS3885315.1 hypothetical protein [Bradyrhizobium elkanii]MCS4215659.1 hypothetical protein [Bradyrhizobium elkanii]MCW2188752.1 hypothetical protein [Bradyrhizobium elkanii]
MSDKPPPDFDDDIKRGQTLSRVVINVTKSMAEAKAAGMELVAKGIIVRVVQVQDLIGWAGVPNYMTADQVADQIREHLCNLKGIDPKSGRFVTQSITQNNSSGSKH